MWALHGSAGENQIRDEEKKKRERLETYLIAGILFLFPNLIPSREGHLVKKKETNVCTFHNYWWFFEVAIAEFFIFVLWFFLSSG